MKDKELNPNIWKDLKPWLTNRYILAIAIALCWVLFFDRYDLISQYKITYRIKQMEADKSFYKKEIERIRQEQLMMQNNPYFIEKFARENFVLKKDNEDIFVFVSKDSTDNI